MKRIIDIPDEMYDDIIHGYICSEYADTLIQLIPSSKPYEERPQGEWLFTEIDENCHVYGQCSVCKERNRIGKACRFCGAEMKGGAG